MSRQTVETTIADAQGQEHRYECVPLGFRQAVRLKFKLIKILLPVFGNSARSLFGEGVESKGDNTTISLGKLSGVADGIEAMFGEIMTAIPEDLLMEILGNTIRFTKVAGSQVAERLPLRSEESLTEAYCGGNWGEFYAAVWWSLLVNFAPFGKANNWTLSALFQWLTDSLSEDRIKRWTATFVAQSDLPGSTGEESSTD